MQSDLAGRLKCPECGSLKNWKDGLRYTKNGDVQRWLCRNCGYRFSESNVEVDVSTQSLKGLNPRANLSNVNITSRKLSIEKSFDPFPFQSREDIASHSVSSVAKPINSFRAYNRERRVCETDGVLKNLVEVQSRIEKRAAGATKPTSAEVKGKIVEFTWWLMKQGYADLTVRNYTRNIRLLMERGANIYDADSVKDRIARQEWSAATRHVAINAYTAFLRMLGQKWEPPICKVTRKIPFIPTEQEIDALVAGCGKKTAAFLQLLKETAMRAGEANKIEWTDIDANSRIITLNNPEKNSNTRIFKVSLKLIAMLRALPKTNSRVFGGGPTDNRKSPFLRSRRLIAQKLQNPRLLRISFHTLRHWKATMLYHKTKDPLFVKEFLGHKKLDTTLLYIQLAHTLFNEKADEFHVKVAAKPEEIKQLLEIGFEYVCEKADLIYFRKRK